MRKLLKRFENLMVAVTFAEASEYDEAKRLVGSSGEEDEACDAVQTAGGKVLLKRAGE